MKNIKKPFFTLSLVLFIPMSLIMRLIINDAMVTWGAIFFIGAFFSAMVAVFLLALREYIKSSSPKRNPQKNDSQDQPQNNQHNNLFADSKIKAEKISASSHFLLREENEDGQKYAFPEFQSVIFRFLARFFPFILIQIQKMFSQIDTRPAEELHGVFSQSQRIDLIPSQHSTRAFTILLDQKTALYFSQDGDKFIYDGWEVGEYEEKGEITIFDDLKK